MMIAILGMTHLAIQAAFLQAEMRLGDASRAPVLCAGPVRPTSNGGGC